MAMVFSRRRRDLICTQNNNRKVKKNIPKKTELGKKYVFLAKCIENALLREKYCRQNRGIENEPEKLKKKLLITDYAKVKKKKRTKTVATTRKP